MLPAGFGARRLLLPLLVLLAASVAGAKWLQNHWGVEETDNAQLQTHLVDISSRLPGTIASVPVQQHQQVTPGTPLVLLDSRDAQAALQRAQADLLEARRQADALQAEAGSSRSGAAAAADQAAADQQVARAEYERSAADLRRLEFLLREGGVSRQEVDRARASFRQAQGQLTRSEATALQARASQSQVGVQQQKAAAARARILQAEAALAAARLQLSYQRILAPSAGRIGSLTAEPGRHVQPGQPLMTLVSSNPWVEANFKETQLEALRPGQPAEVSIDAFPNIPLHGHVLSVAPAADDASPVGRRGDRLDRGDARGDRRQHHQRRPVAHSGQPRGHPGGGGLGGDRLRHGQCGDDPLERMAQ